MRCFETEEQIRVTAVHGTVGEQFLWADTDIKPWVNFVEGDTGVVEILNVCGTFEMTAEGLNIVMDESVAMVSGTCIDFEVNDKQCGPDEDCETEKVELSPETRFAVLDNNDCPQWHVTFEQICQLIAEQACIKVCEQLCGMGEQADVLSDTKLVAVNGVGESCHCALIPASALQCDTPPEPFECGDEQSGDI